MLEMRPNCELCDRDLPPESDDAWICSFECTFCQECVEERLEDGVCPNCRGELSTRPTRETHHLKRYPGSTKRVLSQQASGS